jgi:hypothetical protein
MTNQVVALTNHVITSSISWPEAVVFSVVAISVAWVLSTLFSH